MVDGQTNQAKDVLKHLEVCAAHPEEAGSMDKHQRKIIDKGRENRKEILKKRTNLVLRNITKSGEIDVLLYSYQNDVTVKEELAWLSDIFKLIKDTNQEMIELVIITTLKSYGSQTLMRKCFYLSTKSITG